MEEKIREAAERRNGSTQRGTYRLVAHTKRLRDAVADGAERRLHQVRRTARRGRFVAEDAYDGVAIRIRHKPIRAVAYAFVAGVATVLMAGAVARLARRG